MRILIHTILVTVCFVAALGLTQLRAQEKAVEMYYHVAKAPLLGARFNPDFASFGFMAAGPSQAYKAYRVEAKGIQLIVGVDDRKRVCWIQTIDRRFESPEGLRTGDALARVLSKSVEKVRTNIGWGWYVRLPSGSFSAGSPAAIAAEPVLRRPGEPVCSAALRRHLLDSR